MGNLVTEEDHDVVARAWRTLVGSGLNVSDRGRLRPEIHQAWLEANHP